MLISVLVLTYKPKKDALLKTLWSIIHQEKVEVEVIVSDDGSDENCFEAVEAFFKREGFKKYKLLKSDTNHGTCYNMFKALDSANGELVKCISPADYLYRKDILYDWAMYMNENHTDVCFGDPVYYEGDNEKRTILSVRRCPQYVKIYLPEHYSTWNAVKYYVVCRDVSVGAVFMVKTLLLKEYLGLVVGKVKLAEDNVFRIMVADGVKMLYYPFPVVWYEYGSGVSTNKENKYDDILRDDYDNTSRVIEGRVEGKTMRSKRLKAFLHINYREFDSNIAAKLGRLALFPILLKNKIHNRYAPVYSSTFCDHDFIDKIDGGVVAG